ncbi:MAG: cyclodeaminase/cyclohydrolase family protein [Lachnospiraceae bacterium]|nr:cyclodeaminase/cyclohydrolase family protein [Lachnospiraceae bacterium]
MLTDLSVRDFSSQLADKVPVPGGGGAAALAGGLAAALGSMAAKYTVGKKAYEDYEGDLNEMIKTCGELRLKLLALVEKDAEAFEPLSKAYKLSKDDPDRDEILENATLEAAYVPLDIMDACADVIDVLDELVEKCSRLMISDVACAAILAGAALKAASINVFVNTSSMNNRMKAEELELTADRLLEDYIPLSEVISETVTADLREGTD